jgi:phosphatidylglycerol:prolipoprotein diacylglycerol transferase
MLIYFAGEFIPKKKAGDLGLGYFLWYGIVRSALEPLRDSTFSTFGKHTIAPSLIISLI